MKCTSILIGLVVCHMTSFSQVGIGTTTPNSQSILDLSSTNSGLLIPRMTSAQKLGLGLTAEDAGMVIFQTDIPAPPLQTPKGLYTFDGTSWIAPIGNGSSSGQTLRWDGSKWVAASNLFNPGSAIGIGTSSPWGQLHVHSISNPTTKIQVTNGNGLGGQVNGLIMGVNTSNAQAFVLQQEPKPLWFGTGGAERMRIDSVGNVGINKTNPTATLDVNGSTKLTSLNVNGPLTASETLTANGPLIANGPITASETLTANGPLIANGPITASETLTANGSLIANGPITASETLTANGPLIVNGPLTVGVTGTPLNSIIRYSAMIDIPSMISDADFIYHDSIPNLTTSATVLISPSQAITGIIIGYARVSAPGWVEIKFMNMSHEAVDPEELMFYITIFQ